MPARRICHPATGARHLHPLGPRDTDLVDSARGSWDKPRMTSSPVIVGTDLSDASFPAIRQGAEWAERHQAPLLIAHLSTNLELFRTNEDQLKHGLAELVSSLIKRDVEVILGKGPAHRGLIELASEREAGLLVVGASDHTRIGRVFLGSTAASVARYAECSVLVARASPANGPILVGTDFSDAVTSALDVAGSEADKRSSKLILLHSMYEPGSPLNLLEPLVISPPRPTEEDLKAREQAARTTLESLLAARGGHGEILVVHEEPGRALVEQAEKSGAALIIVGTHGRTGFSRMALGSVAEAVAAQAPCSVLIARSS